MHHRTQWRYQSRNFEEAQLKERARCLWNGTSIPVRSSEHLIVRWKKEKKNWRNRIHDEHENIRLFPLPLPLSLSSFRLRCAENSTRRRIERSGHVMGPKRNCFQFEAGQVKIKSIAELKTFHISCVRVRWCSFFSFSFSILLVPSFLFYIIFSHRVDDRTLNVLLS